MEPIVGVGGMIFLPQNYVKEVRKLCDKYHIILIFDECQTGFGRLGKWYAYQEYEVVPDMVTSAKAMGLGFAVSSVTMKEDLAKKVEGSISHFCSHQNDPLSARVVSFVIDEIIKRDLLNRNLIIGEKLLKGLIDISNHSEYLTHPRGRGLMCAFDLPFDLVGDNRSITNRLIRLMEEEGIFIQAIRQGKTFRIMPNYLISNEEIDYFLSKLDRCLYKL